jgi:hypothetical protein
MAHSTRRTNQKPPTTLGRVEPVELHAAIGDEVDTNATGLTNREVQEPATDPAPGDESVGPQ